MWENQCIFAADSIGPGCVQKLNVARLFPRAPGTTWSTRLKGRSNRTYTAQQYKSLASHGRAPDIGARPDLLCLA